VRHVNAADVLPHRLLRKVQRYIKGYMYVSDSGELDLRRRRQTLRLWRRGLTSAEIAAEVHLGERRVRQIIAEERKSFQDRTAANFHRHG
jgi:DNA-binding NarL/FixJ family response regulator